MSRLASGGRVDRSAPLRFRYDGVAYEGLAGDTLASALLANGVDVVTRSPYLERPRGIYGAGTEEPNAFVQVGSEPMLQATRVALHDGLEADSLTGGKGRLVDDADSGRHDKAVLHCDVLVVGAGPAGLSAARAAAASGARVVLVDEQRELGGSLLDAPQSVDGLDADDWIARCAQELADAPECRVLLDATALGAYDGGYALVVQRRGPGRKRLWRVRAEQTVVAAGALERPLVFADNDRPGVMLASAARAYVNRYAVAPGERAVVFGTNDSIYEAALDLARAGIDVALVVDARADVAPALAGDLAERGIELALGAHVTGVDGAERVEAVRVGRGAEARSVACDLLAVSGGFTPAVHLYSHLRGGTRYAAELACFVPTDDLPALTVAGAAAGAFALAACLADGHDAGCDAAARTGFAPDPDVVAAAGDAAAPGAFAELWSIPGEDGNWSSHFIDLHRDATVADVRRAVGAGMRSIEHVKRYTTIGTGADQGKTSGLNAAGIVAELIDEPVAEIGTSTTRPPYVPVSFATLAGRRRGSLHDPERITPIHAWHVERGATFEDVGQWKRGWYYPEGDEDMDAAVLRECRAAREGVAMMDASTLGKIEIQGPDAAELLNRIYTNRFDTLAVGMARYGLMCRADGMVFDDGVVMRLAEDRFLATTTTSGAANVLNWLEEWHQTQWPELRVYMTSVTEQWATVAVVGPKSRAVLERLTSIPLDNESFPFMAIRDGEVAGMPARVVRVSFSGELAFEVNVAGFDGPAIWSAIAAAGEPEGITPYGTETMHVLRAEKGFIIVGQDTDGTVTPHDLGMSWIVSKAKDDFVGARSLTRPDIVRDDRLQLVGVLPIDPTQRLPEGAQLVADPDQPVPMTMVGHVTSSYMSAALERTFALALVAGGQARIGETLFAPLPGGAIAVKVTEPVFYDREGARRDG